MPAMEQLLQDFRYALRSLWRQPSFAVTAVLTLALGIGATSAIFSVVNAVILRPLPFERPDRLVAITNYWTTTGRIGSTVSAPDFRDWEAQNQSFASMAYYQGGETSVTVNGTADYAYSYIVTPRFFETLGVRAAQGRLLSAEEFTAGGPPAVVIADAFWQRQYNRDPRAIGSSIKFADRIFTIVGVLPPGMRHPGRAEIYAPFWIRPATTSRSGHNYAVIGRLKDGVSIAQADAEMKSIASRLAAQYPASNAGKLAAVTSLHERLVGSTRNTLYVLLGAVALVLLIACANVANLLLARSTSREREMVVRAAVGASRTRLVRQLLTESAVLGILAGLLGVWLARLGVVALIATAPATLPRIAEVRVDLVVLAFALGISLLASFLFGMAPALQVSGVQLSEGIRQGGKGSSIGARGSWARNVFVVAEVALAVMLVVGAGLLTRSLIALTSVQMGFEPEQLLVLRTQVPVRSFEEAPRATAFYRDVLAELRTLPGVESVGAVTSVPTIVQSNGAYQVEGRADLAKTGVSSPQALFTVVTPDYFKTMRVPVTKGRDFTDADRRDAPFVAVINESLAREAFGTEDPIGRRIQCGLDTMEFMTIVGVVGDVRTEGPSAPARPELYMPYEQHPGPATALSIVARTRTADPLTLTQTMQRKIRERNADVPVRVTTMEGTLETATAAPRFQTYLLVMFAGVALLLALAGIYGVMAYSVSQRVPELGVRIALGATPGDIMRLVIGQGAVLAGIGLVFGLALALLSGRVIESFLFGVTAHDPVILAAVTAVVAIATLAACYIPGRRAVRVDPMVALRAE
jgi:putative ABC transport system permease protein